MLEKSGGLQIQSIKTASSRADRLACLPELILKGNESVRGWWSMLDARRRLNLAVVKRGNAVSITFAFPELTHPRQPKGPGARLPTLPKVPDRAVEVFRGGGGDVSVAEGGQGGLSQEKGRHKTHCKSFKDFARGKGASGAVSKVLAVAVVACREAKSVSS